MTHAPTPWRCDEYGVITGGDGRLTSVAETHLCKWQAAQKRARERAAEQGITSDLGTCAAMVSEAEQNGLFIVRAVNAHDDLLAACRLLTEWASDKADLPDGLDVAIGAAEDASAKAT